MYFIIEKRLLLGRLTVADATNLQREDRKLLIKIARGFDFNAAVIVFDIPLEICLARNAARARRIPEDALRKQYELLEASLKTIDHEGFSYVYILNQQDQDRVKIKIGPPKAPRRPRRHNR
jgi:protein phosphatase